MIYKYENCDVCQIYDSIMINQCYHSKGCIHLTNDDNYIVQASIIVVDDQIKFIDAVLKVNKVCALS